MSEYLRNVDQAKTGLSEYLRNVDQAKTGLSEYLRNVDQAKTGSYTCSVSVLIAKAQMGLC